MKKLVTLAITSLLVLQPGEYKNTSCKKAQQSSVDPDQPVFKKLEGNRSLGLASREAQKSVKEHGSVLVDEIRTQAVLRCYGIRLFPGETSSSKFFGIENLREAYMLTKFVNRGDDPDKKLGKCLEGIASEIMLARREGHSCVAFLLDDIVVSSEEVAASAPDYWVRKGDRIQGISVACVERNEAEE